MYSKPVAAPGRRNWGAPWWHKAFLVGHQYFSGYRLPTMCGNENFIITDIFGTIKGIDI